ncbi:MAG TPA: DUF2339 domain-containing protein [Gaiellaceae bacterium]|nr:DUF2339 domain-containing protein [Gaiellaceae bacterium]
MQGPPDDRLEALEREVEELRARVRRLESVGPPAQPARPTQPTPAAVPKTPPPPPAPARPPIALEDLLGGRVLGWVGGTAVVLGVAFFLVMAANRGWIDETTRVLLAFVGSTALLGGGLYLHERQGRTQAALAAVATAIAALYLTLTAATKLYGLIDPVLALVFAALVGAVATAVAVRWDEQVVAGIGIVGALLAPPLVEAGTDSASLAFMTIALIAAVGVLLWRRWSWLGIAAFVVSAPQLLEWLYEEHDDRLGLSLGVLAGFWLLYVVAAIGYELREPTAKLRLVSASLLLANAALLAGAGWAILDDTGHGSAATVWVIGAAAVHIGGGIPAYGGRMSKEIAALIMAVGTALAALGLALAIDGPALVAGWSAEALVLAWAARRFGDPRGQVGSAAFFTLAVAHTILIEAPPEALRVGVDDFVRAAIAVGVVGATAAALSRLSSLPELRTTYVGVAATAAVYLPSLAIVSAFGSDELEPGQTPQVLLSAFWAVAGLTGIVVGLLRDVKLLRLGGLGLLLLAAAKVFAYDLSELESIYRALSFIALGLLLLGGAFAYQRIRKDAAE